MTNTERPDAIAGAILEGKVAVLVDGTPFALIAPITIFKLFQSSEDYYQKFDIATFCGCCASFPLWYRCFSLHYILLSPRFIKKCRQRPC